MKNSKRSTISSKPLKVSILIVVVSAFGFVVNEYTYAQVDHSGHNHSSQKKAQRDPNRLWCNEHGLYEDECLLCHPELANKKTRKDEDASKEQQPRDPNRLWCNEHGLYEDECVICHPEIADKKSHEGHDHGSETGGGLWCNEHNLAERNCGICQPQLASTLLPGENLKIRLPSKNAASKAGIETTHPRLADTSASVEVYCEVQYNQNQLAKITPLATGVIYRIHADIGDVVEQGDLLVEIASTEVAAAKRDLLISIVNERVKRLAYEREQQLMEKEISAAQHYQQAKAEYQMAQMATTTVRQMLLNYGFTEAEVLEIEETNSSSSIVHVHAPFSGTLVERSAVIGEAVQPGATLFTLVDLSSMWLNLSIPESKMMSLKKGLTVQASFRSMPGFVATGILTWISPSITEPSRFVEARAMLENEEGLLRSNMFGNAKILINTVANALTVPIQSVQQHERNPFVFVKVEEDLYELRRVEVGNTSGNYVQIISGLSLNDSIIATGSFTMMSEFLKSRLGAGCVHD